MNLIQKIRSWFFGKDEIIETPIVDESPMVVEAPVVEKPIVKEEVKKMIENQESKPKPKRKYNKKKKSTSETK